MTEDMDKKKKRWSITGVNINVSGRKVCKRELSVKLPAQLKLKRSQIQ